MKRFRVSGHFFTATAAVMLFPLVAQGEQRVHEHGAAQLQLAVSNGQVELLFHSPAVNILGFEHSPRTERQKSALKQARNWFTTTPLVGSSGQCTVASVAIEGNQLEEGRRQSKDHHEQHDHEDHQAHADSEHSEFEVMQQLNCELNVDREWVTPLLDRFPAIEELEVQWVTPDGQGATTLTGTSNSFRF